MRSKKAAATAWAPIKPGHGNSPVLTALLALLALALHWTATYYIARALDHLDP
jgi:hypothetical protein